MACDSATAASRGHSFIHHPMICEAIPSRHCLAATVVKWTSPGPVLPTQFRWEGPGNSNSTIDIVDESAGTPSPNDDMLLSIVSTFALGVHMHHARQLSLARPSHGERRANYVTGERALSARRQGISNGKPPMRDLADQPIPNPDCGVVCSRATCTVSGTILAVTLRIMSVLSVKSAEPCLTSARKVRGNFFMRKLVVSSAGS